MGKRLPLCALCGEKLTAGARVTLQYGGLPGKPCVGWHIGRGEKDCASCDAAAEALLRKSQDDKDAGKERIVPLLAGIERRGEGRLVAGKKWRERNA